MNKKKIILIGSTGSIGRNVLRVVREHAERFTIVGLAAASNHGALLKQVREFRPQRVALSDAHAAEQYGRSAGKACPHVLPGEEGVVELCRSGEGDILVNAVVGAAGLRPTLAAIGRVARICLANKESLVAGGDLVTRRAAEQGTEILPIDSEHVALHQCLSGRKIGSVRRLVLTASGGPFRNRSQESMMEISVQEALEHPTWQMGPKITVDSATLMNKGLEVIEAMHLFGVGPEQVEVLVHPQSVIHSLVEFIDGSYIAQLGETDMRHAIRYALGYPERLPRPESFDLTRQGPLTFERPDPDRFPSLRLAYRAAKRRGTAPAVLNGANEVAVEAFLEGRLSFVEIPEVIGRTMDRVSIVDEPEESAIYQADREARREARLLLSSLSGR